MKNGLRSSLDDEPLEKRTSQLSEECVALSIELLDALRPTSNHPLPKVRQLYLKLYDAIELGHLPFDSQLPSSRHMAVLLGLGRNTVISVYEQLTAEGLLQADGRRGTRVVRQVVATSRSTADLLQWPLSDRCSALLSRQSRSRVLAPGEPDSSLFPAVQWRKALDKTYRLGVDQLGYQRESLQETREAIARYLATYRSLYVSPRQIIVTTSTRQSLNLAAAMFTKAGDVAWAECPGYVGAVDAFRLHGLEVIPCKVDSAGLVPPLKRRRPSLIYLTPCFQYPLGMSLNPVRRTELLLLSKKYGSVVFEDDYDSEFRDNLQPRPALAAEPGGARVLHAGTFSKLLFPAVRVAWLVVPESCADAANQYLRVIGGGNNTIAQAAVAELLDNGSIARHLKRARQVYGQRRRQLVAALGDCDSVFPVENSSACLSLVLRLKKSVALSPLTDSLADQGIGPQPLEYLDWRMKDPKRCKALVIGLGNVDTLGIDDAVARLKSALRSVEST